MPLLPLRSCRAFAAFVPIALLALLLPGLAVASTITITFENGYYDPNPPVTGEHGPYDYLEGGARYAGFWFNDAGTPTGHEVGGHTHVIWDDTASSLVDNVHSWRGGMQGARISLEDGSPFTVVSVDYRVSRREPWDGTDPNSQFARLPWSFAFDDVQLMLSTDTTPATPDFATFEAQWTAFSIDDGSQRDAGGGVLDPFGTAADSPWRTLQVTGFENVQQFFIGHTGAEVAIDSIVISTGDGGIGAPEPGTGVLVGLGLGLLAGRRRTSRGTRREG